jgi:hypothetical protein
VFENAIAGKNDAEYQVVTITVFHVTTLMLIILSIDAREE